MDDLIKRYCQTNKGRHIVSTSMWSPIKLCRVVFKNGEIHYRVGDKVLNQKEADAWKIEQQKLYKEKWMKYYSLTEDDFELSEEKLAKIIHDETIGCIRNIALIEIGCGDNKELKNAIQECLPKIKEIGLG